MSVPEFCVVNGRVVRRNPYPPEERTSNVDYFGRQLPPLPPTAPFPHKFYDVDRSLSLHRPGQTVQVRVTKAVDVGWCKLSQSFKARVEAGHENLQDKEVFIKIFDPLYINPDDIPDGISPCLLRLTS